MERLQVPQADVELGCYPRRTNDTRRAWDAADEYVLAFLAGEIDDGEDRSPVDLSGTVVVVNDASGALCTVLAAAPGDVHPISFCDSYRSQLATVENLEHNAIDADRVTLLSSLDPLPDHLDVLVVKIPRTLALLEFQLARLAPHVDERTVVVGAGMTKHVHTSTIEAFERLIGPTRTSLARKKARLLHAVRDTTLPAPPEPDAQTYVLEPGRLVVHHHAGVFASERLDIGTRFFLEHLPEHAGTMRIVDLGCGNGIVGLVAALENPDAEVLCVDESYLAVESARRTLDANLSDTSMTETVVGDGLRRFARRVPIERGSVDLVFNNPPFHEDHALSDATAWQMFTDAHAALRSGGQLWVVGNRHLAYHAKLKRIFGNCEVIASNSKFVVYRASRR